MELKIMSYNTQHCLNFLTQKIDFDFVILTAKRFNSGFGKVDFEKGNDSVKPILNSK